MRKAGALSTTRVSVGTEFGFEGSAPAPPDQCSLTKASKAASFSSPTTALIFSAALFVASEVVTDPALSSESFAVSSRATLRSCPTCSSVSCSFAFNSRAKLESANIASSTGSVTGTLASAAGDGEAAGEDDGEADAAGEGDAAAVATAFVAAVFVGALVVQPAKAASSASDGSRGLREIIFILSTLLKDSFNAPESFPARGRVCVALLAPN